MDADEASSVDGGPLRPETSELETDVPRLPNTPPSSAPGFQRLRHQAPDATNGPASLALLVNGSSPGNASVSQMVP